MHLSSHPQVFVNVFAFIKSNVFLFYDDNFFHKKVFLFRKRFICWSFCHITMFWIYFCNVLMVSRCVTVPDCELLHFTPGLTVPPLTRWWSMMMIIVVMMTTMVMMMAPSDPMTSARSGNVTPELIEPHIKPNRSWASNPSWNLRHDEYDDVRGQTRSNFLALRVQMLHSGIFDYAPISQDWDIDAADHVFLSRGYESGVLRVCWGLERTSTCPEIRFWQEASRELCTTELNLDNIVVLGAVRCCNTTAHSDV